MSKTISDNEFFTGLSKTDWFDSEEGQLSVDVIETTHEVIVRSAIAGVRAEDLDITMTHDTLTIRGERQEHSAQKIGDVIHVQECHWGHFSRSVILPSNVDPDNADAVLKNGILTIRMKKTGSQSNIPVIDLGE